jgi:tetratricopeptide (TPR) repeat protein
LTRVIASALATVGLLIVAEAPALARHHDDGATPAAAPAAAPANGEPLTQAVPRLEQAFAAHPNDASIGAELADVYTQSGRPDLALGVTSRLINAGQRTAGLFYFTGVAYRELGQLQNSLAALQQAEVLDPTSSSVLFALTSEYVAVGRIGDALREAKRDATFNLHDERSHLNYGMTLALTHNFDAARSEFVAAASIAPADPRPYTLIGRTFIDNNDPADALNYFNKAVSLDPKDVDALNGRAAAFTLAKNVPAAVNTLEQVLAIVPDAPSKVAVMTQEARLLIAAGQPALAEQSLRRGVQAFPNLEVAHVAYGDFLALAGRLPEAQQQYQLAAGPNLTGADGISRLGTLAMHANQPAQAVQLFNRVALLRPGSDVAWIDLGQALLLTRNVKDAQLAFRKSFALNRTPDALAGIATCDFATHNYREALTIFDTLLAQANTFVANNPRLLFTMGRTYDLTHQPAKARVAYSRLLALVPHGSAEEHMVKGYLASLNRPGAVPAAQHAGAKH